MYFQYHVLVTNDETSPVAIVLQWHLQHANMENRIKEHKTGFGPLSYARGVARFAEAFPGPAHV